MATPSDQSSGSITSRSATPGGIVVISRPRRDLVGIHPGRVVGGDGLDLAVWRVLATTGLAIVWPSAAAAGRSTCPRPAPRSAPRSGKDTTAASRPTAATPRARGRDAPPPGRASQERWTTYVGAWVCSAKATARAVRGDLDADRAATRSSTAAPVRAAGDQHRQRVVEERARPRSESASAYRHRSPRAWPGDTAPDRSVKPPKDMKNLRRRVPQLGKPGNLGQRLGPRDRSAPGETRSRSQRPALRLPASRAIASSSVWPGHRVAHVADSRDAAGRRRARSAPEVVDPAGSAGGGSDRRKVDVRIDPAGEDKQARWRRSSSRPRRSGRDRPDRGRRRIPMSATRLALGGNHRPAADDQVKRFGRHCFHLSQVTPVPVQPTSCNEKPLSHRDGRGVGVRAFYPPMLADRCCSAR